MPLALVVEPDPHERTLHATVLRRMPGVSVIAVSTASEAFDVASIEPPSVVLTAATLPDADAESLLAKLRSICEPACVIVVGEDEQNPAFSSDPLVHFVPKPVEARRVKRLVRASTRATLDRQPLFKPAEYIQLLCMGGHSSALHCFEDQHPLGKIFVREGAVWSAQDSDGEGEAALRRLLSNERAVAVAQPLGDCPVERTIQRRWEHLLLEAAQELDESRHERKVTLENEVVAHLKAASQAVLRGDLQDAAKEFAAAAALAPEDRVIRHNVERLARLGYRADEPEERHDD